MLLIQIQMILKQHVKKKKKKKKKKIIYVNINIKFIPFLLSK